MEKTGTTMEYNKVVELHPRSEDVERSVSSRSLPDESGRKSGVPETSIHGVEGGSVETANTGGVIYGGMGNTYNLIQVSLKEEALTAMITGRGLGTLKNNIALRSNQVSLVDTTGTSLSETKSRVRLDSTSSDKGVTVEDGQKAATEAAAEAVAEAVAEALEECMPVVELRRPDVILQSKRLSVDRCDVETDCENTDDLVKSGWVIVSPEGERASCSTPVLHGESADKSSDACSIPYQVRVNELATIRQSERVDVDNTDHAGMPVQIPFDTGGSHLNGGTADCASAQYASSKHPDTKEIRLGNQVKECTTAHENMDFKKGGDGTSTRDAADGCWTPGMVTSRHTRRETETEEMLLKHLLEQWKQVDERDRAIVQELLNSVIHHGKHQSEALRKLLPMLRNMSREIAPGGPIPHNQVVKDSYIRLFTKELTDIECDLSQKTATNVANYILTIGRNNPKSLSEICNEMDRLDQISYE
ncbi:uncharacterized protein LOC124113879 isoform X2 [Haliotis rufescens]|uniref:uncharacterized protein LOC124113879 isoform X2 n=1 Tax=Haliotis rufescens TaxID=6454 RepID=UPI00201EB901|nr:uncharacterized protein LOC124113879 isoform X2 [Haliotis rufescens]